MTSNMLCEKAKLWRYTPRRTLYVQWTCTLSDNALDRYTYSHVAQPRCVVNTIAPCRKLKVYVGASQNARLNVMQNNIKQRLSRPR